MAGPSGYLGQYNQNENPIYPQFWEPFKKDAVSSQCHATQQSIPKIFISNGDQQSTLLPGQTTDDFILRTTVPLDDSAISANQLPESTTDDSTFYNLSLAFGTPHETLPYSASFGSDTVPSPLETKSGVNELLGTSSAVSANSNVPVAGCYISSSGSETRPSTHTFSDPQTPQTPDSRLTRDAFRTHVYYRIQPDSQGVLHCPECSFSIAKSPDFKKHLDEEHIHPYFCNEGHGHQIFVSYSSWSRHRKEQHGGKQVSYQVYCPEPRCHRSKARPYKRDENLYSHLSRLHKELLELIERDDSDIVYVLKKSHASLLDYIWKKCDATENGEATRRASKLLSVNTKFSDDINFPRNIPHSPAPSLSSESEFSNAAVVHRSRHRRQSSVRRSRPRQFEQERHARAKSVCTIPTVESERNDLLAWHHVSGSLDWSPASSNKSASGCAILDTANGSPASPCFFPQPISPAFGSQNTAGLPGYAQAEAMTNQLLDLTLLSLPGPAFQSPVYPPAFPPHTNGQLQTISMHPASNQSNELDLFSSTPLPNAVGETIQYLGATQLSTSALAASPTLNLAVSTSPEFNSEPSQATFESSQIFGSPLYFD